VVDLPVLDQGTPRRGVLVAPTDLELNPRRYAAAAWRRARRSRQERPS
jgi:hypothetical protein